LLTVAGTVFDLLLDYHSKTRTLHSFLPRLAKALVPRLNVTTSHEFYQAVCVGPVFDTAFIARLRRSVSAFITPGQILPCTQELLSDLAKLLVVVSPQQKAAGPPRKKRRILPAPLGPDSNRLDDSDEARAVHAALSSRLVITILSSLLVKTLKPDVLEQLRATVDEFDAGVLSNMVNEFVGLDLVRPSWGQQIVLAAILRIRYGLRQTRCPIQTRRVPGDEDIIAEEALLLRMIEDSTLSAELITEAVSHVLCFSPRSVSYALTQVRVLTQGQRSQEHIRHVWGLALARIQRDRVDRLSLTWNGSLAHLTNHAWFPLWFLLLDRQLQLIE
jgi:hypothetical protein